MKKIIAGMVLLALLTAFIPQQQTKIIFFGDSITELGVKPGGYVTLVDSLCKAEGKAGLYDISGSGISGNKVYDLYLRLEDDVLSKNPDIVFIWVGVNDVWHKTLLGTGTDADKFEKFYQAILKKLKDRNIKAVLCTPGVVGEKTDMSNPLDGDLNRYSNIIRELAQKNQLPLVDLRKIWVDYLKGHNPDNQEKNILTYDKVHPNAAGNRFLSHIMWDKIKSLN